MSGTEKIKAKILEDAEARLVRYWSRLMLKHGRL